MPQTPQASSSSTSSSSASSPTPFSSTSSWLKFKKWRSKRRRRRRRLRLRLTTNAPPSAGVPLNAKLSNHNDDDDDGRRVDCTTRAQAKACDEHTTGGCHATRSRFNLVPRRLANLLGRALSPNPRRGAAAATTAASSRANDESRVQVEHGFAPLSHQQEQQQQHGDDDDDKTTHEPDHHCAQDIGEHLDEAKNQWSERSKDEEKFATHLPPPPPPPAQEDHLCHQQFTRIIKLTADDKSSEQDIARRCANECKSAGRCCCCCSSSASPLQSVATNCCVQLKECEESARICSINKNENKQKDVDKTSVLQTTRLTPLSTPDAANSMQQQQQQKLCDSTGKVDKLAEHATSAHKQQSDTTNTSSHYCVAAPPLSSDNMECGKSSLGLVVETMRGESASQQQQLSDGVCYLTAKTRDNQCALHGSNVTLNAEQQPQPQASDTKLQLSSSKTTEGDDKISVAVVAANLVAANDDISSNAKEQRQEQQQPSSVTKFGAQQKVPRKQSLHAGNTIIKTPRDKAKSVATWPLAKQTLDNNLPAEIRLGHFGDCEDILSPFLAGRLFGSIMAFNAPRPTNTMATIPPSHHDQCMSQQMNMIEQAIALQAIDGGMAIDGIRCTRQLRTHTNPPANETTINNELRLVDQMRAFNYNHRRIYARPYECPSTGWLYNATGLQPINSGASASMKAKLFAITGYRRRSYDDQEGDNDINIILQPSDIDDMEKRAKASYSQFKAANSIIADSSTSRSQHCTQEAIKNLTSPPRTNQLKPTLVDTLVNLTGTPCVKSTSIINDQSKSSSSKAPFDLATYQMTSRFNIPSEQTKLRALTNIFEDITLAKCLLDQDYNQTVRLFIKKSALNWNFNSFTFDALCCGRSLTELLLHLFDFYNLYKIFQLDIVKVLKCFKLLEFGYHSTNPYHNSVHAADVTQAMHCFIQENKIRKHMTDLEILCSILAAVCHDLDHPGVNQSFLIATKNPLAGLYKNNSVLENHHWRFALCIFKEAKLFDHFDQNIMGDMKEQLKHLILATDIARQNDYLKRFKELTTSHKFSMSNTEDRALVLQMALKCADLGNPCRPWLISRVWSNLICDEFYRMGRIERRLGIPLTPICQREKTSIAGIQTDFFRFIVLPLLELWHKFLESPLSDLLMSNFDHNYKRWQRANRIVQQLRRRKSMACLEPMPDDQEQDGSNYATEMQNNIKSNRRIRSSSLFIDPTALSEISIMNHSHYKTAKRASSDYIKSGNGRLEVLRDFQLNLKIEKSPVISRARKFKRLDQNEPMNKFSVSNIKHANVCSKLVEEHQTEDGTLSAISKQRTNKTNQTNTHSTQQQQTSSIVTSFRKVLSPIQDSGDGTSPEVQKQQSQKTYHQDSCSDDSSESSSPGSHSSECPSPVMRRSTSSRVSMTEQHNLHTQNKQLNQYHDTTNTTIRGKLSVGKHSVTHSLQSPFYVNSNRRRESDPGCLSDNYELAAAIVLIQYQSNSLYNKRRSSLPICISKRRSSG